MNHAVPFASTWSVYPDVPSAAEQLTAALANDSPDAIVAAFGTNDVSFLVALAQNLGGSLDETSPEPYIENVLALRAVAAARKLPFFLALAPPRNVASDPAVQVTADLNHLTLNELDPATVIDFYSAMRAPADYVDALHLGPTGQAKRADGARNVLNPW